ncbi:MAG: hypothetical protein EBZ14_06195 [Gammaproteobacteria bacterium]|nr:hypothetical protein [Gammaproteobacteria bacterium]
MSEIVALHDEGRSATGIFPTQTLRDLIDAGSVTASQPITADLVQPASIDLRLGDFAWRVQASFLPGPDATVEDKVRAFEMHRIDLMDGAVLEKGCVYIVPLLESLDLPEDVSAFANPKSSTGRLDIFTRVISDRGTRFDLIRAGYTGPLYAEVSPKTFSIAVRTGSRLTQLRLRRGRSEVSPEDLLQLHAKTRLIDTAVDPDIQVKIRQAAKAVPGVIDVHEMRTRRMGADIFADMHVRVRPRISVSEGHRVADEVMDRLKSEFPTLTDVVVHIDPEDDHEDLPLVPLQSREALESAVRVVLKRQRVPEGVDWDARAFRLTLHYLNGRLMGELVLPRVDGQSVDPLACATLAEALVSSTALDQVDVLWMDS